MLRYIAYGIRCYQERPVHPVRRERWEIEGALRGRIAPVIPGRKIRAVERRLWVLPPSYGHGWTGEGGDALVVALSPVAIPIAIEIAASRAAREGDLLSWDMSDADVAWLDGKMSTVASRGVRPDAIELLRQEQLVIELCVRILEALPSAFLESTSGDPCVVVDAALLWMQRHLASGISECDVADSMHFSLPHLRRLFHRVMGCSPRDALQQMRMREIDRFIACSDLSLSEIASRCGFSTASGLCRAYRRMRGRSPNDVRRERPAVNLAP